MKAVVSEKKKKEVEKLVKLLQSEPIIGIIDLTNLPSAQFQKIKHKLRKDLNVTVSKKSLIKIALEKVKDSKKGIEKLEEFLKNSMPALIFTKEDAFKIAKILDKNKSSTAAKPGQIAPKDLMVPEGPTAFPPGPIIGELGAAGIKAAIEDGKVVIKEEAVIVKKGEEISQQQSDMLAKFGIEPMEIGLNILAVYQDGDVFDSEVLSVDETEYLNRIKTAAGEAMNLAVYVAYPTKDTIEILLQKAERDKLALESKVPEEAQESPAEEPKAKEEPKEEPKEEAPTEEAPKEEVPTESTPEEQPQEEAPKEEPEAEPKAEETPKEEPVQEDTTQNSNETTENELKDQSGYSEEAVKETEKLINQIKDNS